MIVLCCLIKKKSLDSWNSVSKSSADRHSSWYKRWFLGSPAAAALRFPTLTEADIFGGRSISLKGKMKKKRKKNHQQHLFPVRVTLDRPRRHAAVF